MCAGAERGAQQLSGPCVGRKLQVGRRQLAVSLISLQAAWGLLYLFDDARIGFVEPCVQFEGVIRGSSDPARPCFPFMLGAVFLTARAPPLLLTSRTPPLDPFRDPFRASREAGLPWWLPQNLQDGLPDDWPPSIEQPPPQRVLRASRAASFPRWLSQTEQDGLPDDRPAVEAAQGSEAPSRLKTAALSLLKRAIFSTSEDGIFSTRLETQPNGQDNQGAARAASAEADAASGAR